MSLSNFVTERKSEAHLVAVADGVHAWIGAGGDSNAGAIETPEGVIVIDTRARVRPSARHDHRRWLPQAHPLGVRPAE